MLGARVCGATLKRWIDKDCVFPFGVVVFKPYMMYEMGTAVLAVAGESTGKTFIGHSDFQLTDNVVRIVLHVSCYFTCNLSVCKMRKLTVVLWPAMCVFLFADTKDVRAARRTKTPPCYTAITTLCFWLLLLRYVLVSNCVCVIYCPPSHVRHRRLLG